MNVSVAPSAIALRPARPITIAVLAMGGQGGGVLADWIVALAERQRLVRAGDLGARRRAAHRRHDLLRRDDRARRARAADPVLSLMPAPGDVDIVIAAELMEAGRAILRGLVTPDRTTLIASTHRSLAVVEKTAPGDGIADRVARSTRRRTSRPSASSPSTWRRSPTQTAA